MKKSFSRFLFLSFGIAFLSGYIYGKEPQWKNFNDGMAQAKKTGKKVLIDVYTDWCTWCKKMDANTYSDAKVQEYLRKNYILVKLNPEKDGDVLYDGKKFSAAEFSQGMGITGYPATLFLKSSGEPITVLPGYAEADMFIHVISFIGEDHYQKKKFADYLTERGVKK